MSKTQIDYSNTIIYKIFCNDTKITDKYIGFTTNFSQRKYYHKQNCINSSRPKYDNNLYNVIRNHGGWENWTMKIMAKYNLPNHNEAKNKELEYIANHNATLNFTSIKENNNIDDTSSGKNDSNGNSEKVSNEIVDQDFIKYKKLLKNSEKYKCEFCNFFTHVKCNYEKHIKSEKHVRQQKIQMLATKKYKENNVFCDNCKKMYKNRSGLWRHYKKCVSNVNQIDNSNNKLDEITSITENQEHNNLDITDTKQLTKLVVNLLTQNQELTKQVLELSKQHTVSNSNTVNNVNNVNNVNTVNNFSINMFLKEKCKDALNITDFVDTLVLGVSDLEETARIGYVNGISKIFINGLRKLDIYKRPLHCSDLKRSILYIKEDNQWIKDEKSMLTHAIKQVSKKNINNIFEWQKLNPEYNDSESKQNDKFNKIIFETMSGSSKEEQLNNYDKIIKTIAKEVVIEK